MRVLSDDTIYYFPVLKNITGDDKTFIHTSSVTRCLYIHYIIIIILDRENGRGE